MTVYMQLAKGSKLAYKIYS